MYESNQEVFNTVADHLIRQGTKAEIIDKDGDTVCQLRTPDGLACALGSLIPPGEYDEKLEGIGPATALRQIGAISDAVGHDFLMSLVEIHDDHEPEDWPACLIEEAKASGLQLPPCLAPTAPAERIAETIAP